MAYEVKLPELGENIESGEVAKVLVSAGDKIAKDQPILELETDKAAVEIPADAGGTVQDVQVKAGDQIAIHQVILTLEASEAPAAEKAPEPAPAPEAPTEKAPKESPPPQAPPKEAPEAEKAPAPMETIPIPAAPSVRRLARELGVDIHQVSGSGPGGRISIEDVKAHVRTRAPAQAPAGVPETAAPAPLPPFEQWGAVERAPMSQVRRQTAAHMTRAWTLPHVTQHDFADITLLEQERKRLAPRVEAAGGKLTVTAIVLKAVVSALKAYPRCNASLDLGAGEVVYKHYYHAGVAVDTAHGLLVPVIRHIDRKNIVELAIELAEMAAKARNRKLTPEAMEGATFTVTNLGGLGGAHFTPVINWPQAAILGLSRAAMSPGYIEGEWQPRLRLPLSLSYDHRLIDGADAVRFVRRIVEALEDPFLLTLES